MASTIICTYCGISNQPGESFCENCGGQLDVGQAPASPPVVVQMPQATPAPGVTLLNRRYRVLEILGEGGFGKVYKVEDRQLNNRLLAIKRLDLASVPTKEHQQAIRSFEQEAIILGSLMHPNLPRIYEYFVENGNYYLVMDFIEGETLHGRLQRLPSHLLPAAKVVNIGIQLATVLDYLHTRQPPIIFRDLKPENIMITFKDEVYLIDFGIVRHFKPGQSSDTIKWGTPEYAAPEQIRGQQTSIRSDIYSLGAVLHQLLSGDIPTFPPNFAPLKFTGPAQVDLGKLVTRMLEPDKQARPASMAEIKKELERIAQALQQGATTAGKQSSQTNKKARIGAPQPQPAPPRQKPQPPPPPPLKARGDLLHIYRQHSDAIRALAWSPDGDKLASAGEDRQVHVWQALSGKPIFTYQQHTRAVNALAWSPNSRYLASASNDYGVHIWQAASGKSLRCYQEHTHWVQALSWSSDGRLIASGDAAHQIHLWDAHSGQRNRLYQDHKEGILALAFSPDARLIASADQGGEIHLWEVASGVVRAVLKGHTRAVNALAFSPDSKQLASASSDRTVALWETTGGKQIATYTAHARMVNAVVWLPTGKLIASASKDQTVQLWDCSTRQTLFTYRGHTSGVSALACSPDGSYLASASGDAPVIHVWCAR
jgi:serine/threonine protein kinase